MHFLGEFFYIHNLQRKTARLLSKNIEEVAQHYHSQAQKSKKSENREPSILIFIISVSVSIALIIGISQFAFSLVPERSEFIKTERVADETYKEFSHRLETISEKSAKEIKATRKDS